MKKIIIPLMIFLIAFSFNCIGTEIFTEQFGVLADYTTLGYDYSSSPCSGIDKPVPSPFGSYAWGLNQSTNCVATNTQNMFTPLTSPVESGTITLFFDVGINYVNKTGLVYYLTMSLYNRTTSGGTKIISIDFANATFTTTSNYAGFSECSGPLPQYYNNSAYLILNLDTKTYDLSINNTLLCEDYTLTSGAITSIRSIHFSASQLANQNVMAYIDNIQIATTTTNLSAFPEGMPCITGEDCLSGKCEYGVCKRKLFKEQCDNSQQCLSNACLNGICTKPSLWQLTDASKTEMVGDDSNTNNMISLAVMIGLPAVLIIYGAGSAIIILLAIGIFFVSGFFFTIVGWLSPFITLALVLVALITLVFVFVIKANS